MYNDRLRAAMAPTLVAASGQALTCTADKTDYTADLKAGLTYRVTAMTGNLYIGLAAVAATGAITLANVLLAVPSGTSATFTMPSNAATIHFATDSGAGKGGTIAQVL